MARRAAEPPSKRVRTRLSSRNNPASNPADVESSGTANDDLEDRESTNSQAEVPNQTQTGKRPEDDSDDETSDSQTQVTAREHHEDQPEPDESRRAPRHHLGARGSRQTQDNRSDSDSDSEVGSNSDTEVLAWGQQEGQSEPDESAELEDLGSAYLQNVRTRRYTSG